MSSSQLTQLPSGRFAARGRFSSLARWLEIGLVATLFVLVPSHRALAQNSGRVDGIVHDQSGAVVPNAAVVLRNESSGTELKATTNSSGFYSIDLVPPATYTLVVQLKGFKTFNQPGIAVHADDRLSVPVGLELGEQVQTVEVTGAAAALVTTDSGAKTQVIGSEQISNLSTLGRSAAELLTLLPGVVNSGFSPLSGSSFGSNGVESFNVNGLRSDQNDVRLDSAHMIDPGCNCGNIIEPNMDMIQEFSLKTSNFEADQGRSAMIMDTVTKSGGSAYHGEAYYYGRNAVFNANDFSNNLAGLPRPQSKFNYPGFNIGGPVRFPHSDFNKNNDKLFFFYAMEWQRQLPDPGTELATVPTAKMRTGDFSELLNSQFCTTDSKGNVTGGRYLNMPCVLGDPNQWGGPALPGNILPAKDITQNGTIFLNVFPMANYVDPNGRYNFAGRPLLPLNRDEETARIDYNINDSTRMYVRIGRNRDHQFYPYGLWSGENSGWTSNIPEPTPTLGNNSGEALTINLVKIINPTLTNEFQFNTQALNLPNQYLDPKKLSKSALGFKFKGMTFTQKGVPGFEQGQSYGGDFIPQITDAWDYFGGSPGAGRWGEGDVGNRIFADKTEFEWLDNVTKVHATHTIKFGVSIDRTRNDQNGGPVPEGYLVTDHWGLGTGNEFGDILSEHFMGFNQGVPNNDGLWRFWNVEWYAQDAWKATRRLTLNYGARFSWMEPWYEVRGLADTFDPRFYDPTQPTNFLNGIRTAKAGQVSAAVFPNPHPVIQPRLGFAYDVFGTGKTVIRGGLGTFVQRDQGNISFFMANSVPFSFTANPNIFGKGFATLSEIETADPFGGLGNLSVQALDPRDASQPQTYEWSFTLSQNIGLKTVLETSYVGNVNRHLYRNVNLNAIAPGKMFKPGTTICCANGDDNWIDYATYKPWGTITWSNHSDTSNYNSLQVTARRNVSHGLTLLTSYTWSKALGYTTSFQGVIDPFDSRRNYALLPWDRTHLLNFSYIYQLPSLGAKHFSSSRIAKGVLDGWQLSGITHYSSGQPLGIVHGTIRCASPASQPTLCHDLGNFRGDSIGWYGTPDIALDPIILANPQLGAGYTNVGTHWLNPSSITMPAVGQLGTFEQPSFKGPGSANWNLTMFKDFSLGERRRLEFRWAMFDMFNYAQPDNPNISPVWNLVLPANATSYSQGTVQLVNPKDFGVISDKHGHREMEAAIKIYF